MELKGFYNMDCMDALPDIPDKYFDLAIIDPPYGKAEGSVSRTGGTWAKKYGTKINNWDIAPGGGFFKELFRVSKNQIIWGGIIFHYHLQGALSFGEKQTFRKTLLWQCVNMRGQVLTATQSWLRCRQAGKVTDSTQRKSQLNYTSGY